MQGWLRSLTYYWPRGAAYIFRAAVVIGLPVLLAEFVALVVSIGAASLGLVDAQSALAALFLPAALVLVPWGVGRLLSENTFND